jgi:rhamnosyltransferase
MKSHLGHYYQSLDLVRGLAVFTVFVWHFIHFNGGNLASPLIFPLSFFTEGHTGVAIFMTLSGYLFAKLADGKQIHYPHFLWNRFLRLAPLLITILLLAALKEAIDGTLSWHYLENIGRGIIYPTLPNGAWSVTVETHFYLFFPALLFISNRNKYLFLTLLIIPIAIRLIIFLAYGEVQSAAYWTIIGRLDQFICGMLLFQLKDFLRGRWYLAAIIGFLFLSALYKFDLMGGLYRDPGLKSPSSIWVIWPLIEGISYACLIAWLDVSFGHSDSRLIRFIALVGTYSYSIYLIHFFVVFEMPKMINHYLYPLDNQYILLLFSIPCFLLLLPLSYFSYEYIEKPFLKYRKKYLIELEKNVNH